MAVPCPDGILYAVRRGQTLTRIAGIFNVTVNALIQANPGINPLNLLIGQILCIPGVRDRICPRGRLHTVAPGETMFLIAQEFGITLEELIAANPFIPDPRLIFPGEQLCIPVAFFRACCIVLQPTEDAEHLDIGGVTLIEARDGQWRVTFAGTGLPDPAIFGDFDTYSGDIVFREIEQLVPLARAGTGTPAVWAGARLTTISPFGANLVVIFPFNSQTEERGPDILRGLIIECQPRPGNL